jgi:PAS domain S-box-containing protein
MAKSDHEEPQLRSVALKNATSILSARQRAERELVTAKEDLERRSAELATSLAMMKATLEATTDGILVTDRFGNVTTFNENYVRMWEMPPGVMATGKHEQLLQFALRYFPDPSAFLARVADIYRTSPPQSFDELTLNDGRVMERYSKIQFVDEANVGRVWILRDITARRHSERALREQREWFKVTLSSIGDAVITTDTAANVTFLNSVAEKMTGWAAADAIGKPLDEVFVIVHEQTRQPSANPLRTVLREGTVVGLANHTALIRKTGGETAIEDSAAPIRDSAGNVVGAVMVFHDVTDRRKADDALRQSHAQFSAIIEASPVGIYLVDSQLRMRQINARARPVFAPLTNLEGRDIAQVLSALWPPEAAKDMMRLFVETLSTGKSYFSKGFSETREDRKVQEHYDWELHRVTMPGGEQGIVCYFIDISAHVLAQRALRDNEQQLRATFNQVAVGMATAALNGRFEQVNHRFCHILGYTVEELTARRFLELTFAEDLPRTQREMQRLLAGEIPHYSFEKRYIRKDGSLVWSLTTVGLMKNELGSPERFIGVIEDISDRKQAEDARRQTAQRLQLALDAGQLGDWTWDAPTDTLSYGDRFAEIYGLPAGSSITWIELRECLHPEDRPRVQEARERALATRRNYDVEYRIVRPSGAERWVAVQGRGSYSDQLEVTGMSGVAQDVTELRTGRAILEDRERQLSLIYHNVSDVIFNLAVGPNGEFRFASINRAFLTATRRVESQVIGRRVQEVIPEPSCSLVLAHYREAIEQRKTVRWEETAEYPGGRKTGIVSVTPIFDHAGKCVNLIGTVHDISERRATEDARLHLAAVVESSHDAILTMTLEGTIMSWNKGAEHVFGYTAAEIVGRSILLLLPSDRVNEEPAILEQLKRGERIDHYETVRQRKDGTQVDIALTVSPIKDSSGRVAGVSKIARDVTKQRLAQEELRNSEQRFRDLADAMPQIVWTTKPDGTVDYRNHQWFDYTGLPASAVTPDGEPPMIHPDDLKHCMDTWVEAVDTGNDYECEFRLKNRNGEYRWHLGRALPQRDPRGKIIRWYGSSTDIHEQRLTAEALREEYTVTEHLNQVAQALASELDLSKIVQIITDAGTKIIRAQFGAFFYNVLDDAGASYMLYTLSGIAREAFAKFPMPRATGMFGPTFRGEGVIRVADVRKDSRYGHNAPYHGMPEGHPSVVSFLAAPVFDRAGKVLGGLFFGHPKPGAFTERDEKIIVGIAAQAAAAMETSRLYQAEQQARNAAEQANRTKDHFLATLSHELRTPLTPVLAILSGLGEENAIPPALAPDLATVRRNVELEARLIDDLLDLTRITRGKLELHCERVDLGSLIENAINTCLPDLAAKHLKLVRELQPGGTVLVADSARITQILWNLLRNAIKFTPSDGTITLRSHPAPRDGAGSNVIVEVHDTGIGMEPPQIEKMFDAFEQGGRKITQQFGGLGLGLAISKAIAEAHRGTIAGTSDGLGRGSVFTLTLPLEGPAEPAATAQPPITAPAAANPSAGEATRHRARILLVEDHADTAAVLVRMLKRTGYNVVHAASIGAALETAASAANTAPFDLVMSDLSLPDGSGLELMQELKSKYQLRGIALSGFGMDADREQSAAAGFSRHLTKPIDIAIVRAAIAELLKEK